MQPCTISRFKQWSTVHNGWLQSVMRSLGDSHVNEFPTAAPSRLPPHTEPAAVAAGQRSTPPWSLSVAGGCQTPPIDQEAWVKERRRVRGT